MDNENLFQLWLNSRQQDNPTGFKALRYSKDNPKPYWLTPEDMLALLNAKSGWDLMLNPHPYQKFNFDYPTSALNISNRNSLNFNNKGIQDAIVLASQKPKNPLTQIYSVLDEANRQYPYPINIGDILMKSQIPQSIYSHELGHYQDLRPNPYKMWSYPNYGWMTYQGLTGGLQQREAPAIIAENKFRNSVKKKY